MNFVITPNPETWVAMAFILFVGVVLYYKLPGKVATALDQRSSRDCSRIGGSAEASRPKPRRCLPITNSALRMRMLRPRKS